MSKALTEVRSLSRSYTVAAVKTLAGIMKQPKAPAAARVMAANSLLDRGWGKPDQQHSLEIGPSDAFLELMRRVSAGEFSKPVEGKLIEHQATDDPA